MQRGEELGGVAPEGVREQLNSGKEGGTGSSQQGGVVHGGIGHVRGGVGEGEGEGSLEEGGG